MKFFYYIDKKTKETICEFACNENGVTTLHAKYVFEDKTSAKNILEMALHAQKDFEKIDFDKITEK